MQFIFENPLSQIVVLVGMVRTICQSCIKFENESNHLCSPPHCFHAVNIVFV